MSNMTKKWMTLSDHQVDVYIPDNSRVITGIAIEDIARTSSIFVDGNKARSHTDPIDISPKADIHQNLPTHVKAIFAKRENGKRPERIKVDMADFHQLASLTGHHRYLIFLYDKTGEKAVDEKNREHDILDVYMAIEFIASPETLAAFVGDLKLEEIAISRRLVLAWDHDKEDIESARKRLHPHAKELRKRQGLATPAYKLSHTQKGINKRLQSWIYIDTTKAHVQSEPGQYQGLHNQDRWQEHTKNFHNISFPFRTTAHWRSPKHVGEIVARVTVSTEITPYEQMSQYQQGWIKTDVQRIGVSKIIVFSHMDNMKTLYVQADEGEENDELRKTISYLCHKSLGEWLPGPRCWLLKDEKCRNVLSIMAEKNIPTYDGKIRVKHIEGKSAALHSFETPDGAMHTIKYPEDNWVIKPDNIQQKLRVSTACYSHKIGRLYKNKRSEKWEWLIPHEGIELAAQIISNVPLRY